MGRRAFIRRDWRKSPRGQASLSIESKQATTTRRPRRTTVPSRHRVIGSSIRFGPGLPPAWASCAQWVHRRGQAPGSRSALSPWETLAYTSGDRKAAEMAWLCSIKIQLDRSVGRPLRVPAVDARHSVRRVLRYGRAGRAAQEKKTCDTQRSLRDPSRPKCKVTSYWPGPSLNGSKIAKTTAMPSSPLSFGVW